MHLASSIRSFRTPDVSAFVKAILDNDLQTAQSLYQKIKNKYPILLTRDLEEAKTWVKDQCRGTTRYGLVASSGALRLKPEGIYVKNDIDVENWFLNDKDIKDVSSGFDALAKKRSDGMAFAVGDGNHSLAAAKECSLLSDCEAAKYALVEVVNLHDPAIEFEPIYRVVFGADPKKVLNDFKSALGK